MIFGMIGAGTLSQAVASHPLKAGHEVIFSNSRGPDTLVDLVAQLGRGASPAPSPRQARLISSSWR